LPAADAAHRRRCQLAARVSVAGRVVSEDEAGPLEHHVVDWDDDYDDYDDEPAQGDAAA